MANLQIPEHLADELEIAAECSGRTKEEIAVEILAAHFDDVSLPLSAYSGEELTRLKESIQQVRRGEVVTEEQVDRFFDDWFRELKSR